MATPKVGSARIDERGKAYGGKAGDQTTREVMIQSWYDRWTNPWVLLRPVYAEDAEKIARCMKMACTNPNIGYDQWQRNSLYAAAEPFGFDVSKVKTKTETDCSALVRVCCAFAGIFGLAPDTRTTNMATRMVATGRFIKLTAWKYIHSSKLLRPGDVLVTKKQGHTVVVLSAGSLAYTDAPATSVKTATVLANDVNVRSGPGVDYKVLGVVNKGATLELTGDVSGGWTGVRYNGAKAYIYGRYVKAVDAK